jgi:exosortase/archaeosortase family protein
MLMTFFALSTAVALLFGGPMLDRVVIALSAVPIAVAANAARITASAILQETAGQRLADLVFHDLAGWLMMPFGLFLLWIEMRVLARLLTAPPGPIAIFPPKARKRDTLRSAHLVRREAAPQALPAQG